MRDDSLAKKICRYLKKRKLDQEWKEAKDPRGKRGRRWALEAMLQTLFGGLLALKPSLHRLDEDLREGRGVLPGQPHPAPVPDATLQWLLAKLDPGWVRALLVRFIKQEMERKSLEGQPLPIKAVAFDGKCLRVGKAPCCPNCQKQRRRKAKSRFLHRVIRVIGISCEPKVFWDQKPLGAHENEMGALEAFWEEVVAAFKDRFEVATFDAGYTSLANATRVDEDGYGYVMALKENQPELLREAKRVLEPLAATGRAEAVSWDRDHGQWVRRSLYRTPEMAGWLEWTHLRQVWLVRTEKFCGEQRPPPGAKAEVVEDRYFLTNLLWNRLKGEGILALVRAHWGIENQGFRTLDMDWEEDYGRPWCSQGLAVDVVGYLRLLAYNVLQLAKGRYLRRRYRSRTLRSFVEEVLQAFVEERAYQQALRVLRPG